MNSEQNPEYTCNNYCSGVLCTSVRTVHCGRLDCAVLRVQYYDFNALQPHGLAFLVFLSN